MELFHVSFLYELASGAVERRDIAVSVIDRSTIEQHWSSILHILDPSFDPKRVKGAITMHRPGDDIEHCSKCDLNLWLL